MKNNGVYLNYLNLFKVLLLISSNFGGIHVSPSKVETIQNFRSAYVVRILCYLFYRVGVNLNFLVSMI